MLRFKFSKGIIKFGIILFLLFTFIFFIYFFSLSLASNPKELIFERSETDLTHACSYYLVYSKDIKNAIKTLNISSIKEVYGNLKSLRIEVLVNESYDEPVPVYGEVFTNLTCSLKNVSSSWECYNNTCNCSLLNVSQNCLNLYSVNYANDTCEYNYTGIVGYKNETKYRESWKLLKEYDVGEKVRIERKINVKKELFEYNLLKKGEDLYEIRVCGEYDFTRTPNGWGVAIDHVPSFNSIDYTWLAWWNTSWLYRRNITINNTQNSNTQTDYQVAINLTYSSNMQPDFSDIRFTYYNATSGTETEIPYWIESKVNSQWAFVWVKVPQIPASGYATIYVYYGNVTPVPTLSNSTAVFGKNVSLYYNRDNYYIALILANREWVSGGTNLGISGDDAGASRTLPAPRVVYDTTITAVYLSTNGLLRWDNVVDNDYSNSLVTSKKILTAHWDDLYISTSYRSDAGVYQITGSDSLGNYIAYRWATTYYSSTSTPADFEILLYDTKYIQFNVYLVWSSATPNEFISKGDGSNYIDLTPRWQNMESVLFAPRAYPEPTYTVGSEEAPVPLVGSIYTYNINLNPQASFTNSSFIRIRTNVTHGYGASYIDKVLITIIDNSSVIQVNNATMVNISSITYGYTYEYNYTLPSTPVRGTWTIKVYANDTSNNWASNQATFFVYLTFTPSISSPFALTTLTGLASNILKNQSFTFSTKTKVETLIPRAQSFTLTHLPFIFTQLSKSQTFSLPHLISLVSSTARNQYFTFSTKINIGTLITKIQTIALTHFPLTLTQLSQYQTFSLPHLISLENYISLSQVWWNTSWQYRKSITINNTLNSNSLTDYQVLVVLDTQSLISAGKMRSDCGDIRFTDSNGVTLLNYWIESGCNTTNTRIWVKVPYIPSSSYATIYVYYGNPTATSLSNGDATFDFFDDFLGTSLNTTKWTVLGSSNAATSVSNSIFTITISSTSGGYYQIRSSTPLPLGIIIEARVNAGGTAGVRGLMPAYSTGTGVIRYDNDVSYGSYYAGAYLSNGADGYSGWSFGVRTADGSSTLATKSNFYSSGFGTWLRNRLIVTQSYQQAFIYNDNWNLLAQSSSSSNTLPSATYYVDLGNMWYSASSTYSFQYDWVRVRKYTYPEPTYTVGSEETPSPYFSLRISLSSLVNLLTSSFTYLPLLLTNFPLTLTQISTVDYFALPHTLALLTSVTQPHTINIVSIPSHFSSYFVQSTQQFTLPSIITTIIDIIPSSQTFSITAIPSLISSLIQIISPFNLIHIVSPELISAYVTVYTPYGNTYGLNETVFVNGTIERKIGPISNARVDLYFYNTSTGPSSAIYWATTYTDNQGRYSFNWYNATKGNFTLQVRFVTSTGYYVANSTTVNLIDPITINDLTPNWYYKDDERIFLTQIQNITVNRGITSINPVSSQNNIAQLFYRQELNGLYTDCNNKDIGDNCWIVGRFRPPAGNLTFTTTYTVYYKLGNSYTFNFSKNISVTHVKDVAVNYKVARFDYSVVGGTARNSGSTTWACDSTVTIYRQWISPSIVSTVQTPPADYYVILIKNQDGMEIGTLSYSVNGGAFIDVYMSADKFWVFESNVASAVVGGSNIRNISVKYSSGAFSYNNGVPYNVNISITIYAFNKTRYYNLSSASVSVPSGSGSKSTTITSLNISNDNLGNYFGGTLSNNYKTSICNSNSLVGRVIVNEKELFSSYFSSEGPFVASRSSVAENIYLSPGTYTLTLKADYYNMPGGPVISFSNGVMVSLTNDFDISYSIQSTKFPGLEDRIKDIKPANIVWMGDTANISLNINSPTYSCNDVYVRLITPWKEYVQYLPSVNSTIQNVNFLVDVPSFPIIRGFGFDSFIVLVNSSNNCFGYRSITPIRLLPPKDVQVILKVPDRVQAGGLFSVYTTFTPMNYSVFYPHIMLDLDGTFGFEVGTSSAKIQTGYTSGRCFDVTIWTTDYEPGVELAYTTTTAGTVFTQNSLRIVPQHMYLIYDKYGFLNIPKNDNYEIGKILVGYGVIQPGDWKMYGAYDFMINGFSAESGVLFSDYSLGPQFLYKFLDVTEVPQSINVITNIGGLILPVQLSTSLLSLQWHNWIAFYPRNFPVYIYQSGSNFYPRTFPNDPSTYWIPCLSSGYSPLIPPFNIYIEYIKTGDDAFTIPAGQRLAVIDNQWVDPWNTAEGVTFKAIAPLKPGIYNITVIVYDDAETGLYWTATKQVRVVSSLPKAQIVVSQEDFPIEDVWAKPTPNNVTMIRRILVSNYQGFNDTQVPWYMNPLPIDAIYINGSMAGVIDYLCDGCTVNPSNVTYVIPGVVYWLDKITYDKTYVDLGSNITGKVSFYVLDNSTTTDFKNVKVNITALVPYDAYPEKDILIIDRILSQQYLWYQFAWTSRTGYEVSWSISKPNTNYVYSSKLYFYNNNSKNMDVWYHIPLVRLPDFDARNIQILTVDGENNIAFMVTTNELILTLKNMTQGEHIVYLEYVPYVAPPVTPVGGGGGGGGAVLPVVKLEPKEYNYTGLPTNLTIWYKVRCENSACAIIVLPSGMYSSWVEIPHETKYGWTITGFLAVPKDGTITFPVYIRIPEATPDGYYNITIVAMDIGTRVEDRGVINIWISRKVKPIIEPYKIIAIVVLVIAIILYINWERVKKWLR